MADLPTDPQVAPTSPETASLASFGAAARTISLAGVAAAIATPNQIRKALGFKLLCRNCGRPILIQIFKGEDWCCEDCRKKLHKEE